MDADERGWTQMGPPMDTDLRRFFCVGARRALPYPLRPLGEGGHRGMRAGARELRMRNCELGVGGRGNFGIVVRRTQMDADEREWTQMGPPIDTDLRRFFL